MRVYSRALVALSFAGAVFLSGHARADDFAEFQYPTHDRTLFVTSLSGSANRLIDDNAPNRDRNSDGSLTSRTDFGWLRNSEPADHYATLALQLVPGWTRRHQNTEQTFGFSETLNQNTRVDESASLTAGTIRYRGGRPVHYGLDVTAALAERQEWSNARSAGGSPTFMVENEDDALVRVYSRSYSAAPFVGLGRIRDVTGGYQMLLMEHRLLEAGVLTRPLSAGARQKLARLVALGYEYGAVRDRPAREIWAQIENVLEADGALSPDGLHVGPALEAIAPLTGASTSISRLALTEGLFRERGWNTSVFVRGAESVATTRQDQHSLDRTTSGGTVTVTESRIPLHTRAVQDRYEVGARLRYAMPIGLSQNSFASLSVARNLHRGAQQTVWEAHAVTQRVIVDRLVASLGMDWTRTLALADEPAADTPSWSADLLGQLDYYLADHLSLTGRLMSVQSRIGAQYSRPENFQVALTYRLIDRLVTPAFPGLTFGGQSHDAR